MVDHVEMQSVPLTAPTISAPMTTVIQSTVPQPVYQQINPSLLQPNLTTPLQIATDTPILGLSQVATPISVGAEVGLNVGLGQMGPSVENVPLNGSRLSFVPPQITPNSQNVPETFSNAESIQRMLLKQNIMR